MTIADLINYILSPGLQERLLSLKVIFIALSAIFLIGIFLLASRTTYLKLRYWQKLEDVSGFKPSKEWKLVKRWKKIKKRLEKDKIEEAKMAILEADKITDDVLKRMGYAGKDFDERLEKIDSRVIYNIELLRDIHRISKNIEEDFQYYVNLKDAKKIIDNYEKILKELQVF